MGTSLGTQRSRLGCLTRRERLTVIVSFETTDGVPDASEPMGNESKRGREQDQHAHAVLRVSIEFPCDAYQSEKTRRFQQAHQCRRFSSAVGLDEREEDIERYGRRHIDQEPSLQVVLGDFACACHQFFVVLDVRRTQIDDQIDDEHHVDDELDDVQGARWTRALPVRAVLVHEKGCRVGRDDRRVDHQQENQPIPGSLQWRVVKNDRTRETTAIGQTVVGNEIFAQGEDLSDPIGDVGKKGAFDLSGSLTFSLQNRFYEQSSLSPSGETPMGIYQRCYSSFATGLSVLRCRSCCCSTDCSRASAGCWNLWTIAD